MATIEREDLHRLVDRLPDAAAPMVMALLSRICPRCGAVATIRTSKPSATPGCRLAYFLCPHCKHVWKAKLLCGHNEQ